MGVHSQEVIFHETFDSPYQFIQNPAAFGSNQSSNNNAWSYWGIWDPSPGNPGVDFGLGEIPDAPAFTGYDGKALIGRKMNGGGNGSNFSLSVANPGTIEFNGIVVSGLSNLALSIDFAAYRSGGGSNTFGNNDFLRVSWKEAGTVDWEPSLLVDYSGLNLQNIGAAFVTENVVLNPSWAAIDFKVDMKVTGNKEHLAIDNFLIAGCQDVDADDICDDVDDCVGDLDACGVCNGPGAIEDCGCTEIPAGDCDCDGNQLDAIDVCGGDCAADADQDGICDDVDDCIGDLDACGICNGPGDSYDCGCSDIPAGDCDCNGNQDDALNVCGGDCAADADQDGVCDDVDDCVGNLDVCGVCNGPGEVYECGCTDIPEGDCDCEGSVSEEVTVTIIPDNFGSEITWSIQDELGDVLMNGGPYVNGNSDPISATSFLCAGCYTFSILDSEEDGICCDWGTGEYSVSAGGELIILGTGQYLGNESIGFCLGQQPLCGLTGSYSGELEGLGEGAEVFLPFESNASIDSIEFVLDFQGPGGDSWASDLEVVITNASGTGALPIWPSDWNSAAAGIYSFTLPGGALQSVVGEAPGIWSIQVINSYEPNPPGQYDLTYAIYLDCAGCTDPLACNYDSTAVEDDGSCINPDPELGCCQLVGDVCTSLEGGSTSQVYQFAAEGSLETLDLELGWTNSVSPEAEANYPGAFGFIIEAPNGACVHIGEGSGALAPSGCVDAGGYEVYGPGWGDPSGNFGNTAVVLQTTLDLGQFGLSGSGAWNVTLANGVSDGDEVSYSANWSMDYLCPVDGAYLGCTDLLACNYSTEATIDNGTCEYMSCGCAISGSQLDTLSFDNWAGQTVQIEVGTNPDPTLFFVDLDFTNVGADGTADPSSFVSDMLVSVVDANGNCAWWGGFNWFGAEGVTSPPNCGAEDELAGASWDACWDVSASGEYSDAIDLSSAGLSGAGIWEVTAYNGWDWVVNECPPSQCSVQHFGDAIYNLEWSLIGACSGYGCMDETACNYSPEATIDDGSCADVDVCGICAGDGSSCEGCTNEFSCNYDPLAIIDDGSCEVVLDTIAGCCFYGDTAIGVSLGGAGSEEVWTVEATSIGGLGEFELAMDFAPSGSMINWASDILVSFIDPSGLCYYFGGNQFTEEGGLSPYLAENNCTSVSTGWPSSWDTNVAGNYSAVVDLTETDLSGNGQWEVAIHNGDIQSSPASYSLVTWEVGGLCIVEACSDPSACNYTPNWTVADNSICLYPGTCESCNPDGTATLNDEDGDGICDADEITACTDAVACNFNSDPTVDSDNALCDYCSCPGDNISSNNPLYSLEIDTLPSLISGMVKYRWYFVANAPADKVGAVQGDDNFPLNISSSTGFYQHPLGGATPNTLTPALLDVDPSLADDSWVTIGIEQAPSGSEGTVDTQVDGVQNWVGAFEGGADIVMNTDIGGIWYVLPTHPNGIAGPDNRVLLGQFVSDGTVTGSFRVQVFPDGLQSDALYVEFDVQSGTSCGCADLLACNYDSTADHDDGSCYYPDVCGICDGPGAIYECGCTAIQEGDCDCEGNVLDACGVCGGTGTDIDADGICDDDDECTDTDAINFNTGNTVCLYEGCTNEEASNYDPNADVDDGSCIVLGCIDGVSADGTPPACNYDPLANTDDGSCEYESCQGCTDNGDSDNIIACNYDPTALIDDGSCDYSCYGCTNPCSLNFDPSATIDDNSCQPAGGCMDSSACNYDSCAVFSFGCVYADEDCESCSGETDGTGVVVVEDTDGDGVCDALEIEGCTDLETPACNYNALATDEDGSCEYCSCIVVDLPQAASLGAATVGASTGGYALAGDLSGAFPDVVDPCGLLQYSLGTDDCGALASVAVIEPGVYQMTVTVTNGVDSLSVPTALTVEVQESPDVCQDKAACNYNQAPPCNYPGQQGDCSDPSNGYAYFKALNPEGTGCSCDSMAGTEIWFESFGADGAAASNPMVPMTDGLLDAGYGYSGAGETDAVGDNGEWSLDIPADLLDGLDGPELEPNYWGVDSEAGNAYFTGSGLNGHELGWVSRSISNLDGNGTWGRLAVQFQAEGQGTGVGDHLQISILSAEGDSLGGSRLDGGEGGLANDAVLSPLVKVESSIRLEVRGQNDGAGEEWRFDDVRLYGWYEGCTDVRASNYNENASFDDGSCEFVWDTLCALTSGLHCDRIWLDPDGLAGDATDLEAVQLTLDSTKVVRIEPNVNLILDKTTLPNGLLCVKGLDLKNGATLFIPDSMTLELMDPFDASLSNGIKGPGRLKISGGVDWSAMDESAQVTTLGCIELNPDQPISVPQGKVLALNGDLDFPVNQAMTLGGRVNMIGSGNRVIRGHTSKVEHLSIELCDEADVVTVEMDTLVVAERLSVVRGELDMASKTLCFASDSSGTGKLDAIPANAEISGSTQGVDADVSQFIAPDSDGVTYTGYTLFATSIEGMTVGDLDGVDGFYLAGFPGTQWPNSFSSVLFWDEVNSEFVEPTGMSDPLDDKGGIWIVIAGSQSPTMRSQGALRSHNESTEYTRLLTRSPSATPVYRGWNFIQNPYQGQLDWEAIMDLNEGIEDQYAIYDTQQQAFQRFGIESLDSLQVSGSRYIQPGNSFWVRVHPDSSETIFQLPPSVIDNGGDGGAYVRNEEEVETEVLLALENAHGTGYMWVRFSEQGSLEYVHRKDASYLPSTQVKRGQLGLELGENTYLSKLLPEETTASLKVVSRANMETTMRVVRASNGMCARVLDQQTGEALDLIEGEELVFTLPEHEADSGRFVLDVRHWAEAEGRMPSCPGSADGRVEVDIQPGTVANVALLDSAGQILEQAMASGVVEFSSLWPGQYTVVTTPVSGTFCPKVHRPVTVMPGEQPELLGLNWTPTPCNSNPVNVAFELYGGGTFGWTLSHEDEVVQQGAGSGEVQVAGLEPGQYTLDVDHACLNESVALNALDPDAPVMEVAWNEVVVSNESAVATLNASFLGQAQSVQWFYLGELVSESVEFALEVNGIGAHEVVLLVESNGCSESKWIEFDVVLDLQGDLDDGWRVQSHGTGWSLSLDAGWAELSWILYDATGRKVASNQHGEGHQIHVPYPTAVGAYRIALMNAEGNAQVKSLMAPIR